MVQQPHEYGSGLRPYGLPVVSTADALSVSQASCAANTASLLALRKKRAKALARGASVLGLPAHAPKESGG